MKDFKRMALKYCDITSAEDSKLLLIANLLLQINGPLEKPQAQEVGNIMLEYLAKKCLTDHLILQRTLDSYPLSEIEMKAGLVSLIAWLVEAVEQSFLAVYFSALLTSFSSSLSWLAVVVTSSIKSAVETTPLILLHLFH
jgi:hypothetical protein